MSAPPPVPPYDGPPPPPHANVRIDCFYCERGIAMEHYSGARIATTTVHDKRGCLPCCDGHARWRMGNSRLFGHGTDCAEAKEAFEKGR